MQDIENNKNEELKTLRTYTSDMAEAVRTNEASVIKIALAEKEKREQEAVFEEARGTKTSRTLFVIGGIILIIGAIFGSLYLIAQKNKKETPTVVEEKIGTFILYNNEIKIDVTNATNITDLAGLINKETLGEAGSTNAIFLQKKVDGSNILLTTKEFLTMIGATAPGALVRSFSDNYLLGKYSTQVGTEKKTSTFLIFETTNYSQTYASMLSWEKTMLRDLYTIFDIKIPEQVEGQTESLLDRQWKDMIINNRDARVLYGDTGEGVLFYAFINKDKLIITDNIETLRKLIAELLLRG